MMLYKLMLVLLIFSAVNAGINTAGLYATVMPESGHAVSQAQVTDVTNTVARASTNPWTALVVLGTLFRFLIELALSLVTIAPMLISFGFPVWLAVVFSAPTTLVLVWGAYEIYTGHVSLPQD